MISQYNVVYTAEQLRRCCEFALGDAGQRARLVPADGPHRRADDLPLPGHGRGFTVTSCPDPTQIAAYAREVHPEIMFGVPRVWEKVYLGVNAALAADPEKKQKFDEGVAAALEIKAAERAGTATQEQQGDLGLPRRRRLLHRARLLGLDAVRGGHHRRGADPPRSSSGSTPSASR